MALATVGAAVMPERDMLDGARNNPGMATASAQWQADLDWIIERFAESTSK
jgi:hypothetical protein